MKKIIPIIAALGIGALFTGCNTVANVEEKETLENQLQNFQNQVEEYSNANNIESMNTRFNKYKLSLYVPENATRVSTDATEILPINEDTSLENTDINDDTLDTNTMTDEIESTQDESITDIDTETDDNENVEIEDEIIDNNDSSTEENTQISTLYSLSSDISESCDDFCELKDEISEAIIETQNLINKVQANEVTLTAEQKMFITEQAKQLKSLGKQLSNITTELSINLSDIATLMRDNNGDIDNLSLKYLVVLDNLVNGNEMLENGLNSLYMINSMFNTNTLEPNNQGRILYGFRRNNEPPIIKDYTIENGEIKETDDTESNAETVDNEENTNKIANIDTYTNTNLNSNIDTFGNRNKNIDTFFNTALLDNELYGNGYGYGMGMYGYPNNNYYNNNMNAQNQNDARYGVTNNVPRRDVDYNRQAEPMKENKKKFKITSNIDTYRDENTPTLSAKFEKIKTSVSSFFNKFKPSKNQNPIQKLTENKD